MVSGLTFKSVIHFESVLVYGVRERYSFIFFFCMYLSSFFNTIY